MLKEHNSYQEALAAAASLGDPTEEFAERSKLYQDRGLSLDTSLPPNFALEVALTAIRDRGLSSAGSAGRVGTIGPASPSRINRWAMISTPRKLLSRLQSWTQNVNFADSCKARELLDQASEGLLKAALEAVR